MIFYRYIAKEFIRPFLYSLSVIVMIFFMQITAQILPRVLYKGIDFEVVIELLVLNMASIVTLALPMSLLISSLMVFGKLSSDNEYTAMRSCGMSLFEMIPPIVSISAVIAVILMFFNANILPNANHHAVALMSDIMRKKPAALIDPGILLTDFPGYAIKIDSVTSGTGYLYGITVFTTSNSQTPVVSVADSGTLYLTKDEKYLEMTMFSGQTISENDNLFITEFETQRIYVENMDSEFTRSGTNQRGEREISNDSLKQLIAKEREIITLELKIYNERLEELIKNIESGTENDSANLVMTDFSQWYSAVGNRYGLIQEINSVNSRLHRINTHKKTLNIYLVEYHKKAALAVGAVIFAILGVSLGILAKNGSAAISVSYSLVFFIAYWAILFGGEFYARASNIDALPAVWAANGLFAVIAVFLLKRVSK